MSETASNVTGVSAVNARGEVLLFVDPLPRGVRPTHVKRRDGRLVVMCGEAPVSVKTYGERANAAASAKGEVIVAELQESSNEIVRATPVPVEVE